MSKFFLIKEMAANASSQTHSVQRVLINDSKTYNCYDDAVYDAKRSISVPSESIIIVETVGKCFGEMVVKTEVVNKVGLAIPANDKKFNDK